MLLAPWGWALEIDKEKHQAAAAVWVDAGISEVFASYFLRTVKDNLGRRGKSVVPGQQRCRVHHLQTFDGPGRFGG